MSLFFVLILILVGIFYINGYNQLPHPVITISLIMAIMCMIYAVQYIHIILSMSYKRYNSYI